MSPMRRKEPWEMDLVDLMDDREEPVLTEEEVDKLIAEAEPRHDGNYELVPERVVSLDKKLYTRAQAYARFAEIAGKQGLMQIGHKETARHYVWECLYSKGGGSIEGSD